MKRKIFLLLVLLLLPIFVQAEECDQNSIKLDSIKLIKKADNVEETAPATINNNKIDFNLKMYEVGDYAEYKVVIENNSSEKMYFDAGNINIDSEYINYHVEYPDNNDEIKPMSKKTITIKVTYNKAVDKENYRSGKYQDASKGTRTLGEKNDNPIINPETSRKFTFILIFIILIVVTIWDKKKSKKTLPLAILLLLPITTYALCNFNIELDSNITIEKTKPNECHYEGNFSSRSRIY